jgi:hypothetical protein
MTTADATLVSARQCRRVESRWQLGAFLAFVVIIEASFLLALPLADHSWITLAVIVAAVVIAARAVHRHSHLKEFAAAELVALHAVASMEARRPGPDPVVVHRTSLDLVGVVPFLIVVQGCFVGMLWGHASSPSSWVGVGLFAVIWLTMSPQQPIGHSPLLVLGPDGVEFSHLRLTLPWSAFAHASLSTGPTGPMLRWHLLDPESAIAQSRLGGFRRKRALNRIRGAGGTIDIPSTWMRGPAEVVLAASWRLAGAARGPVDT